MKKVLTYLVLSIGFILFPLTSKALTKINFSEVSNGKVNTTLHFDKGFIGGLDITFKISGDVNFKEINFTDSIKKYKPVIENNNNVVNIKVTSGGIGSIHNFLNSKKELNLGDIIVTSTKDSSYKIVLDHLTIIDNDWNAVEIKTSEFELENDSFKYVITSEEEQPSTPTTPNTPSTPSTPDKPNTPDTPDEPDTPETPDTPEENPSTPTTPTTPSDSDEDDDDKTTDVDTNKNDTPTTNNSSNNTSSNNASSNNNSSNNVNNKDDKEDNSSEVDNEKEENTKEEDKDKNESKEKDDEKSPLKNYLIISGIVILVVAVGAYIIIKYKK